MEEITLKKNENGEVVQVITRAESWEIPRDKEQIRREIAGHAELIVKLEKELAAIEEFEASEEIEATMALPEVANSVITMPAAEPESPVSI